MAYEIGSIQGRLLPAVEGRVQAFPRGRWQEEFPLLSQVGYRSIELTIETASWSEHPINSAAGRGRLLSMSREWGIALKGICCDVFMESPLTATDETVGNSAQSMLRALLCNCSEAGLPFIEIPFVGKNALAGQPTINQLKWVLDWALPLAERCNIEILLETDLAPQAQLDLLTTFQHPHLGLNYDTGNSTWFGFDPIEELQAYHHGIRNIHIKDCTRKDYSVPLGRGETQFETIFTLLKQLGYQGDFIVQAARQDDDLKAARKYLEFVTELVNRFLSAGSPK